jgi:hypothetical protein
MNDTISVGFWKSSIDQLSDLPFPNQNTANYIEGFLEKFLFQLATIITNGNNI